MLAWLVAAAAGWLAVGVAVSARRRPGYRHRRRTISELGEVGAPDQRPVAVGLFLPVGLAAAVVAEWAGPVGARVLGASLAVGYLVAAVAPCDPGCPVGG